MGKAQGMGHGAWGMEHGAWGMEHGAWGMGHGAWGREQGAGSNLPLKGARAMLICLFSAKICGFLGK